MTSSYSLKDRLFNPLKVAQLSEEIQAVYPDFDGVLFCKTVVDRFSELELKARIEWISACLYSHLPRDYPTALEIILRALPVPCDPSLSDDDFGDFIYASYGHYIATYGCVPHYLQVSLSAIEEVTMRFSAEYAIRRFIINYPDDTLQFLTRWVAHPHYHVRRLVSEGTRPKLPWAQKIDYTPSRYLPLLNPLASDPTRFVTRSVANHLNDVSKIDPSAVIKYLTQWTTLSQIAPKEMHFIIRHSLRTLIKTGHPDALAFLGVDTHFKADISLTLSQSELSIGDTLSFAVTIIPIVTETIILDYILTFQGRTSTPSKKIFKLKTLHLTPGQPITFSKTYRFTPNMTTRPLFPGRHYIQLQANGVQCDAQSFWVH